MTAYRHNSRAPGGGTYRLERRDDAGSTGELVFAAPEPALVARCSCAGASCYSEVLGVRHWQCPRCGRCWDTCSTCGHRTDELVAPWVCPGCGRDRTLARTGPVDLSTDYVPKPSTSVDSKAGKEIEK